MRRMNSSPIFLLMALRDRLILPVVASRAGRGVVRVMVVERRSSKRDVYGVLVSRVRFVGLDGG